MKFGFCGNAYVAQSPIIDDEIAMNCYTEQSESPNAATSIALLHTPGRKKLATASEPSMPSAFTVNGRTFFAAANLYELHADSTLTNWGSIGSHPQAPTMMTANETQLVILNNGNLYVFVFKGAITAASVNAGGTGYAIGDTGNIGTTGAVYTVSAVSGGVVTGFTFTPGSGASVASGVTTQVLTGSGNGAFTVNITAVENNALYAVNMSQFAGLVAQIVFLDGYVIATIQNSHTFQVSNLEDATTWNGLNISTISYFPDNITSMAVLFRYVWFFSAKKAIAYYNAGAGFPPFIPVQGELLENGAGATFASIQADNDLYWLEQNEGGFMVARSMQQGRISTHAIELAWQNYTVTSDAVAWWYQEQGHVFILWYFPTANATWCYDVTESRKTSVPAWSQRGYFVTASGQYIADRAMCHTLNFGKHIVGDWASGNIYELSLKYLTDDGNPIRGNRRTPTVSKENQWLYFRQLEFVLETGISPQPPLTDGLGNPRGAQLMLKWSNDGGKTWSNTYFLDCGQAGQYNIRVIKRMLGRARKRVWDVSWVDPVPWRFNEAYLQLEQEAA